MSTQTGKKKVPLKGPRKSTLVTVGKYNFVEIDPVIVKLLRLEEGDFLDVDVTTDGILLKPSGGRNNGKEQ